MSAPGLTDEAQLARQSLWLKEYRLWLLDTFVLPTFAAAKPAALDVGGGPGVMAEDLSSRMDITVLDRDRGMARKARGKGLEALRGDACTLPFADGSFDVVCCSFLLLWTKGPEIALREMVRVSRGWVLCLAEPDHGGRIDHPAALAPVRDLVVEGMRLEGADPLMGRKLSGLFHACGLVPRIGIYPGAWNIEEIRRNAEEEWGWIVDAAGEGQGLESVKAAWAEALDEGSLFQFDPIFYAIARKGHAPGRGSRQE